MDFPTIPTRTKEWDDNEGNKHLLETYVYGNGCFICKKYVNGIEDKPIPGYIDVFSISDNNPFKALYLLSQMRDDIRTLCLQKNKEDRGRVVGATPSDDNLIGLNTFNNRSEIVAPTTLDRGVQENFHEQLELICDRYTL